jgi:hypothetical protein
MNFATARQREDGRTAVLVQGMHASGSPLLSWLVALLTRSHRGDGDHSDIQALSDLVQNGAIAGISRRILQELGTSWRKPSALFLRGKSIGDSTPLIRDAIRDHYLQWAVAVLRSGSSGSGTVILEDPCICVLSDLWDMAVRELGFQGRTVHVFRNPIEVATLLKETDDLSHPATLQLWTHYNLAALTQCRHYPLIVPYSDLVSPGGGLVGRLAGYLNIAVPLWNEPETQAEWKPLIEPGEHDISIPDHVVDRSPLVPSIVKRLFALLNHWEARNDEQRATELKDLSADFEDQTLFAGNLVAVKLPDQPRPPAPFVSTGARGTRKLLIHYHLFKNAGTSVDAILSRNFRDSWINTEFPRQGQFDHQKAIRLFIQDNPRLAAISSHSLMLPVPGIEGVEIVPILFVRHPLDRMKSAYEFERKQHAKAVGARLAKEQDFAGYIRTRLSIPDDRSCRDFQVSRLAPAMPTIEGSEQEKALAAADQLPFVGLVEEFASSVQRLQQLVQPMFPEFRGFDLRANATPARRDRLEERLEEIRDELGSECFDTAMDCNQGDMALYWKIRGSF